MLDKTAKDHVDIFPSGPLRLPVKRLVSVNSSDAGVIDQCSQYLDLLRAHGLTGTTSKLVSTSWVCFSKSSMHASLNKKPRAPATGAIMHSEDSILHAVRKAEAFIRFRGAKTNGDHRPPE